MTVDTLAERPRWEETVPPSFPPSERSSLPLEPERVAESAVAVPPATVALWVILASVVMLFAGFTSAYLVRRAGPDWMPIYAPPILLVSTAVLLLSSFALELAKTSRRFERAAAFRFWMLAAAGLAVIFLAGQWMAWRELAARGIFLPSSPHSSFFYMLTAVHAAHVLGGVAALFYAFGRKAQQRTARVGATDPVALCATYWHFVTGIWVYLYLLLFVWR
jgi:cytochrome c oxidase subunit 3